MTTDSDESTMKFDGWRALAVAAVMYFSMTGLLLYSFPVFLPFLCETFGWSRASVSWANSLAMAVAGIASPLGGMFVARYGARRGIVIGNLLCIACFVVAGFHTRLWQLYLAYALLFGLGGSLGGILAMTTIVNNWFVKKRSLALSVLLTAGGLGGMLMVPLIMALVNRFGWRIAYLLIAAIVFVLLVIVPAILLVNKPEDLGQVPDGAGSRDEQPSKQSARSLYSTPVDFTAAEALRTPAFWYLTLFGTAVTVGMQGFMLHQVAFLLDIKISPAMAATAYSVFLGISVVGRLGQGFLGLKYPTRLLAIISMLVLIFGMALILWADTLPMVFLYSSIVGLGFGASWVAVMSIIPLYFGKTHYPRIMGYAMPFFTIVGSLGSPLTGRIRDISGSYEAAWKVAIAVLIVGLVALVLARMPLHPSLRKDPANARSRAA